MYKPISNYKNNKSIICSDVEARKNILADQTYCCTKDKGCLPYSRDDCRGSEVARCHNVTTFGACRRNDTAVVALVCGGFQNGLFCLSEEAASRKDPHYSRLPEALEWMINRSIEAESGSVTVCDDGTSYQLCNANATSAPNGAVAYMTCGDLFQREYTCNWHNVTNGVELANLPRHPLGELCAIMITEPPKLSALTIGFIASTAFLVAIIALLSIYYIWKRYCGILLIAGGVGGVGGGGNGGVGGGGNGGVGGGGNGGVGGGGNGVGGGDGNGGGVGGGNGGGSSGGNRGGGGGGNGGGGSGGNGGGRNGG